jgi:hypothetical protein
MSSSASNFLSRSKPVLSHLRRQLKCLRLKEDFNNINRMKPVRLNVAGTVKSKKKPQPAVLDTGYVSIPTEAEMEYYTSGLQLPNKVENLEKLIADTERTGRFDYELCYLLRKQETMDDLEDWMKQVLQKRKGGDRNFGQHSDANRFNRLVEAVERAVEGGGLFADRFQQSLGKSS